MSGTDIDMLSCANCGKGEENSINLKTCTACLSVKYCSRDCQIAHRKQHKKECKKRAAELYDEKLFKEVEREECPICMLPLPIDVVQSVFKSCCGKIICRGCIYAMYVNEGNYLCAFCRTMPKGSDEEEIIRLKKLMDKGNGEAFHQLAGYYAGGRSGLPQDYQKANELWLKGGELGCAEAYYNLGVSYHQECGVERDDKKAKYFYELAAMGGYSLARHNLADIEGRAGNIDRAYKHMVLAARGGHKKALDYVKHGYVNGPVTKDVYANTLRVYQKLIDEVKSDQRDKAVASSMFRNGIWYLAEEEA